MSPVREYILKVGGSVSVRRGFLFGTSYSVVYAGMLNDSIYSVVVEAFSGYRSWAYNLYLPKSQSEIELPKGRLIVLNVSPEEIRFRYQG